MLRLALAAAVLSSIGATAASAQDLWAMSCQQLWMERNSIYKAHGYCFKTRPAIATFGNEGCYIDDERAIRFTATERRVISEISLVERSKMCR